jgi:DNA-binding transcriptional ArsR family regulator
MQLTAGEADRIAEVMGGLSTAARVLILARLLEAPATVTELTDELDMSQTLVSNHLRILRHLSLASGERHGRHIVYSLQDDHVRAMIEQMLTHARHE